MKKMILVFFAFLLTVSLANAIVVFDDGDMHTIDYFLNDKAEIRDNEGGNPTTLTLSSGGTIQWQLYSYGHSQFNLEGGTIFNDIWLYDDSNVKIKDGYVKTHLTAGGNSRVDISGCIYGEEYIGESVRANDNSTIFIRGGQFGLDTAFYAFNNSTIIISGSNFNYDYGIYTRFDLPSGHLTGLLDNGDILNNNFQIEDYASIVLIPEPCTLLLLGLGGMMLRKRNLN
jgi:hypothetical protein